MPCADSFWHGTISTSHFIFKAFYLVLYICIAKIIIMMHCCSVLYRGGTKYKVEGRNLNVAQIRHMVFYNGTLDDKNGTLPPPPPHPPPPPPPPPPRPPPRQNRRHHSDNEMEFMVPTPTLSNGTETECLETWDYMSEVDTCILELETR